jgi:hypothetical protein
MMEKSLAEGTRTGEATVGVAGDVQGFVQVEGGVTKRGHGSLGHELFLLFAVRFLHLSHTHTA